MRRSDRTSEGPSTPLSSRGLAPAVLFFCSRHPVRGRSCSNRVDGLQIRPGRWFTDLRIDFPFSPIKAGQQDMAQVDAIDSIVDFLKTDMLAVEGVAQEQRSRPEFDAANFVDLTNQEVSRVLELRWLMGIRL